LLEHLRERREKLRGRKIRERREKQRGEKFIFLVLIYWLGYVELYQ
jgi:hypothetical protein